MQHPLLLALTTTPGPFSRIAGGSCLSASSPGADTVQQDHAPLLITIIISTGGAVCHSKRAILTGVLLGYCFAMKVAPRGLLGLPGACFAGGVVWRVSDGLPLPRTHTAPSRFVLLQSGGRWCPFRSTHVLRIRSSQMLPSEANPALRIRPPQNVQALPDRPAARNPTSSRSKPLPEGSQVEKS